MSKTRDISLKFPENYTSLLECVFHPLNELVKNVARFTVSPGYCLLNYIIKSTNASATAMNTATINAEFQIC